MRLRYAVLCCFVLIFICHTPSQAEKFKFTYEATKSSDTEGVKKTETINEKRKPLSAKEKLAREAADAAAKGYKVGQTVKVKDGIIYKLAIDPKTKGYTFKLYRRVKKEKTVKKKTTIKKPRVVKHIRNKETDAEQMAREKRQKEEERQKQLEAEQQAIMQAEAARKEAERLRLKKLYDDGYNEGRRLNQWDVVVAAEHRYYEWRTVLNQRTLTTGDGTVIDTEGLGIEDVFYTKTHADMLLLRLMVTQSLELFLEAGMNYERFSDIADMEPVYGGGARYVVAEADFWVDAAVYLDVYARYMTGSISSTYDDIEGSKFNKTLDFSEIDTGFEAGIRIYRLTLSAGVNYGLYSEDVTRDKVLTDPDISIYQDEMEQQNNLGMKVGLEYRMAPHWNVYGQWHSLYKEGPMAGLEYRF